MVMKVGNMFRNSKLTKSLLVSASVCSVLMIGHAQAGNHTNPEVSSKSITAKLRSSAEYLWEKSPDLGVTAALKNKGKSFVKGKAEQMLEKSADEIANVAARKFHEMLYKEMGKKVVNSKGEQIGHIELEAPQFARNFLKRYMGFDAENTVPGVPAAVSRVIGNYAENWLADKLENVVFKSVQGVLREASLRAVAKAMGIAEDKIAELVANHAQGSFGSQLEVSADVEKDLKNGLQALSTKEQAAYSQVGSAFLKNLASRFKIATNAWIQESAQNVANQYAQKLIDETAELSLRYGEFGTAAAITTVATISSGGTGAVLAAGVISGDQYIADGAKEESTLRRTIKNLFGYDNLVSKAKRKAARVIATNLNVNNLLNKLGSRVADLLVPTEEDYDRAFGKFTLEAPSEDDFGFSNLTQVEKPMNFTNLVESAKEKLSKAANAVKMEAKHVASSFAKASDDFAKALNPMLDDDEEDTPEVKSQPVDQTSKSFWQFWK